MSDLQKKKDENKIEYIKRLVYGKLVDKTIDEDYVELSSLIFGQQFSSCECRKRIYGIKYILDEMEKEGYENLSKKELLNKTEDKIKQLEIMKIQYQDQKREYKSYLRADARWKHMIDEMKKGIENLNKYSPISSKNIRTDGDREATLILSDWHLGMINNTAHNVYNLDVAKERMEKLFNKTIEYCKLHNVNVIHIELCGDFLHGNIHLGTRVNAEEDVISQTTLVSEMLSDFVGKISGKISIVKVYGTLGNHSRVSANIKESIDIENFERLITWYMKPRLIKCNNVEIFDNFEEDIITYKIFNLNICCVHGHKEKYSQAISDLSKFKKIFFDELHLGHYHSSASFVDNDMETIVNGTFGGTDEFAQGIRRSNTPSQTLIIYNENGQECIYKIKL